jgi:hypothetical protein
MSGLMIGVLCSVPLVAQGARGKAELKAGAGNITIDYGRPSSPGRDRVEELQVGDVWRMGKDQSATFTTPAGLSFGAVKIPKGSYSIWLKRVAADKFELVFNSQTGKWGTDHDASKDIASVPLKKESLPSLVETFTIELKPAQNGGTFEMMWGKTKLSAAFSF